MTDTKALIDALNNAAYVGIVAVRSGAQGTGIVTTCRYEAIASVSAVLDELDRMGWVVVPKEPTEAMISAWYHTHDEGQRRMAKGETAPFARGDWASMIAAAPKLVETRP